MAINRSLLMSRSAMYPAKMVENIAPSAMFPISVPASDPVNPFFSRYGKKIVAHDPQMANWRNIMMERLIRSGMASGGAADGEDDMERLRAAGGECSGM